MIKYGIPSLTHTHILHCYILETLVIPSDHSSPACLAHLSKGNLPQSDHVLSQKAMSEMAVAQQSFRFDGLTVFDQWDGPLSCN